MTNPDALPHVFDDWDNIKKSLQEAGKFFLGFDFDGTLAHIVKSPDKACIQPEIARILRELTSFRHTLVAVLSGRSLNDLQERLDLNDIALAGDHGLRIKFPDGKEYQPDLTADHENFQSQIERIKEVTATISGVQLERKEFSLTVHYRTADENAGDRLRDALNRLLEGTSFRLQPGRMCWEINPDTHWNKGNAFQLIKRQFFENEPNLFELYVGDDRTDEDVFRIMPNSSYPVIVQSEEKSGQTHARYRLNSQKEVAVFLDELYKIIALI